MDIYAVRLTDAMTSRLYIFASKAFAYAYSFIFFIFLACWYLKHLGNLNKDKICFFIIPKSLFLGFTYLVSGLTIEKSV